MKSRQWTWGSALIVGVALVSAWLLSSCASVDRSVVVPGKTPGATFVGNDQCSHCHAEYTDHFAETAHAKVRLKSPEQTGTIGCELCHGPGSKHVNSGGDWKETIVNPGKKPEACFQCHSGIRARFQLPHRHPVVEGQMNCVDCHNPHGKEIGKPAGGLAMARRNQTCAECHQEQTQSFVFEHEALREGCVVCHDAHGSPNPKMLQQADNNLCLRCHAQAPGPAAQPGQLFIGKVNHTTFVQQGACWSCHSSVHGSNINPRMRY